MDIAHPMYPTTAAGYHEWVIQMSDLSPKETLFSGNCKRLAKFLHDAEASGTKNQEARGFATVYSLNLQGDDNDPAKNDSNSIIYISGYPSARALTEIGSKYQIGPEFFDRHLSFVGDDPTNCRIHPSHYFLPSQQQFVLQLSIPSIGGVHGEWSHEDLRKKHQMNSDKMNEYMHDLRMGKGWRPCSSVVRSSEIHDFLRFSIEQFVTVDISRANPSSDRWTVAIWSDAGADLSNSPVGPWLGSTNHAHFRPINLHGSQPELIGIKHEKRSASVLAGGLPQSLPLLRYAYGRSLERTEMGQNPIYALDELFRFYAASETQYLDMIASVVETSISEDQNTPPERQSDTRMILLHSHRMLRRRLSHITSMLNFLHLPAVWDRAHASPRAKSAMSSLCVDIEYLQLSNQELMARCKHELDIITSQATFEDARRGIVLSRNSQKFAAFAAFYVPLTFTCGVFGMNFVEIDGLKKGVQMWIVVSIPVFLVSLLILFWNSNYVIRIWEGACQRAKRHLGSKREPEPRDIL
ncbi:hypothetical protein FE257_008713 [Aspergillus nanangensis]|uniref:Uncharacterized protein n=1 Tax=Aspergillus nanangensis TaxID=2582783 RepID=A0AAD4CKY2_ASPNN|nr:hypothetical protein FE257_008713 [Aspergillus nanangensis]